MDPAIAAKWSQACYEEVIKGTWSRAIQAATLAIYYNPDAVNPYINRSWAYAEVGAFEKAIEDSNQALSLDPGNAMAFNNRGLVYEKKGNTDRAGEDYVKATMPVDHRTRQPHGLLHGGASVALAETLGSVGSLLCLADPWKQACVGLEINANHLRPVREGQVTGLAKPLHVGKTTQVWEIDITDDEEHLVCVSRITLAVIDRQPEPT